MDTAAYLHALAIHPVKSCAGIEVAEAAVVETGLAHDREWMIVDPQGRFVTQREEPGLARVGTALADGALLLSVGADRVAVPLGHDGPRLEVGVWRSRVQGFDAGEEVAALLSEAFARPLRLVRFVPGQRRLSNRQWTAGRAAPNLFTDGYPVLVLAEASRQDLSARVGRELTMQRFRPNVVLGGVPAYAEDSLTEIRAGDVTLRPGKPCTRCVMTTVDPARGARDGDEPLRTLKAYRWHAALRGPVFGMNATVQIHAPAAVLRVGMPLQLR